MIKNIIFDWSGTLSDDVSPVYRTITKTFDKLGIERITLEEFKREFTLPYMDFYKKYQKAAKKEIVDSTYAKEFSKEKPGPFQGVMPILKHLGKKGIKMVILSSHIQANLEDEIDRYGLEKYFTDVNGSVQDKVKAIVGIIERNGFKPEETALVGDMTHDIAAGRKAKITTIAICWGYQTKEKLLTENPDYIIENIGQIKELVK